MMNKKEKEPSDYHTENILQLARSKEFLQKRDNLFGEKSQEANKNLSNLEKEILNNGALKPDEFLKKIQEIIVGISLLLIILKIVAVDNKRKEESNMNFSFVLL